MPYTIKEIYYTLQGEGANAGRPAVFLRFSGCNLWSGRGEDRQDAMCSFCDTDFRGVDGVNGGVYEDAEDAADVVAACWPDQFAKGRFVVCTGGEPLLQLDEALIAALHARGFTIAVETNGTIAPPPGVDWLTVSPKADAQLAVREGEELKLAFPQNAAPPERFVDLDFGCFYLQPIDGDRRLANTLAAVEYCLNDPRWRISLQIHKVLGIP